jgi:cytidylate kinase
LLKQVLTDPDAPEIVESRLCGWWAYQIGLKCPRVWVAVSDEERARRIQNREGGDYATCLALSQQRQRDDMARYRTLYDIDLNDMTPYSIVVDADEAGADEVFRIVSAELIE